MIVCLLLTVFICKNRFKKAGERKIESVAVSAVVYSFVINKHALSTQQIDCTHHPYIYYKLQDHENYLSDRYLLAKPFFHGIIFKGYACSIFSESLRAYPTDFHL